MFGRSKTNISNANTIISGINMNGDIALRDKSCVSFVDGHHTVKFTTSQTDALEPANTTIIVNGDADVTIQPVDLNKVEVNGSLSIRSAHGPSPSETKGVMVINTLVISGGVLVSDINLHINGQLIIKSTGSLTCTDGIVVDNIVLEKGARITGFVQQHAS